MSSLKTPFVMTNRYLTYATRMAARPGEKEIGMSFWKQHPLDTAIKSAPWRNVAWNPSEFLQQHSEVTCVGHPLEFRFDLLPRAFTPAPSPSPCFPRPVRASVPLTQPMPLPRPPVAPFAAITRPTRPAPRHPPPGTPARDALDVLESGRWLFDPHDAPAWFQHALSSPARRTEPMSPTDPARASAPLPDDVGVNCFSRHTWLFDAVECPAWLRPGAKHAKGTAMRCLEHLF